MQYCKVGFEKSAEPCHFSYKIDYDTIVRNCAKTNVPTIIDLLTIPQPVQIQSSKGLESKI